MLKKSHNFKTLVQSEASDGKPVKARSFQAVPDAANIVHAATSLRLFRRHLLRRQCFPG
jgi:hypothetical protein